MSVIVNVSVAVAVALAVDVAVALTIGLVCCGGYLFSSNVSNPPCGVDRLRAAIRFIETFLIVS